MKRQMILRRVIFAVLLLTIPCVINEEPIYAATSATIDKTSILVIPRRQTGYYDANSNRVDSWGWTPQFNFRVNGPIEGGNIIEVEISTPDGKSWLKFDCVSGAINEYQWWQVDRCGMDIAEEKAAKQTGHYGFKINLRNELKGTTQNLFYGKLKVGKVLTDRTAKDHFEFYVDYDWYLPLAQVYPGDNEDASPLAVSFWFRGRIDEGLVGYLFYKDKEISNTEKTTKGSVHDESFVSTFDTSPFAWSKKQFLFSNTLLYNRSKYDNFPDAFRMDRNPGDYEVKVLRNGKLVRAVKFTIGTDGKITDNNIAWQNALGNRRMIVFAQVAGDEGGARPDIEAWRTEAFFSNTLKGIGVQ
jgi:hypothetical protein